MVRAPPYYYIIICDNRQGDGSPGSKIISASPVPGGSKKRGTTGLGRTIFILKCSDSRRKHITFLKKDKTSRNRKRGWKGTGVTEPTPKTDSDPSATDEWQSLPTRRIDHRFYIVISLNSKSPFIPHLSQTVRFTASSNDLFDRRCWFERMQFGLSKG